jgi:hypothetical protein
MDTAVRQLSSHHQHQAAGNSCSPSSQQEVGARHPLQNQRLVHYSNRIQNYLHPPAAAHNSAFSNIFHPAADNHFGLLQKTHSSVEPNCPSRPSLPRRFPQWYTSPANSFSFNNPAQSSSSPHHFSQLPLGSSFAPAVSSEPSPGPQSLSMAAPGIISNAELARMQELSNSWEPEATVCRPPFRKRYRSANEFLPISRVLS